VKNVLITGGSRGIGKACALTCAAAGWTIVVNYAEDELAAAETCCEIERRGGRGLAVQGDVSKEADVIRIFERACDAYGPLTGVVINAGIVAPALQLADMSAERLKRMFDINTYGAYLCAREAARRMSTSRKGSGGSIVLISSAATRLGSPNEYVDYAGSKAALDTLAIGLSKELGPQGVRVNAIRPGVTETDIHASGGQPDRAQRLGAATPMGRPGRAQEIADAVFYLLGEHSSYVNGALLDVAGGR
jgi:NAD(P)-dependent dehydrogenase (short-subunit alcohol dehydrogenase family)